MWYLPEGEKVVGRAKGGLHGSAYLGRTPDTGGLLYKSMQLREKLDGMSGEEQLELLASDGKLVKRPLVIGEDFVLVGFKPEEWEKVLLK